MAELKIPNLNKKSDKYIFKKKLSLRRKSRKKLFIESLLMMIFSFFLIYINFLIPDKKLIFKNLTSTLEKSFLITKDLFFHLYQIFLVFFIIISSITVLIMLFGSLNRIAKILKRKTKQVSLK